MNVEIRVEDNVKGKGLFATKNIKSGSIIFEEEPLVSCQFSWNAAYRYLACNHCLRPLETAQENASRLAGHHIELPYLECCATDKSSIVQCEICGVQYCSLECRKVALDQYHRTICVQTEETSHPLTQLNEAWKQVHYPPETSSIMLIVRLLAQVIQASDREAAVQQIMQFCHRSVNEDAELAHKFLGEKFADQLSLLHNMLLTALPNDGIEQFLTPEGFQSLVALIGTNGQGVGTSAVSRWVHKTSELPLLDEGKAVLDRFIDDLYDKMDEQSGTFLNNEGVALYKTQSACNHSCSPNTEPSFLHNNHKLSLVALEDIQEGQEICISYLNECFLNRSRHSRRKELMNNYLFVCNCSKCEEEADEPDVSSNEEDEDMSD